MVQGDFIALGRDTILASATSKTITATGVTATSKIFIQAVNPEIAGSDRAIWECAVENTTTNAFDVVINESPDHDFVFDWIAFEG